MISAKMAESEEHAQWSQKRELHFSIKTSNRAIDLQTMSHFIRQFESEKKPRYIIHVLLSLNILMKEKSSK